MVGEMALNLLHFLVSEKLVRGYIVVTGTEFFTSTSTYSFGLLPLGMLSPSSYFTSIYSQIRFLKSHMPHRYHHCVYLLFWLLRWTYPTFNKLCETSKFQ